MTPEDSDRLRRILEFPNGNASFIHAGLYGALDAIERVREMLQTHSFDLDMGRVVDVRDVLAALEGKSE
jgi:hypothetical protein